MYPQQAPAEIVSHFKSYVTGLLLSPLPEESIKNAKGKKNKDNNKYCYNRQKFHSTNNTTVAIAETHLLLQEKRNDL